MTKANDARVSDAGVKGRRAASASLPLPAALLLAVIGGPVLWFGMFYPLWPTTPTGWAAGVASGVGVGLYFAVCAIALDWLQQQHRHKFLFRALGAVLAVSLGIGIFWLTLKGQAFITANFGYVHHSR